MALKIEVSVGVKRDANNPQAIGGTEVEWRVRVSMQSWHDSTKWYYFLETTKTRQEALVVAADLRKTFVSVNDEDVQFHDLTAESPNEQ